ncbi:MAG: HEAT repeat domain-containing protein [Thermovenabulum sp.]|uniref:HEAT repeat domain-containing protein n=1 Tax=Thermovenabulum sp. TaxID=3100335 RepID=UPI003C7C3E40
MPKKTFEISPKVDYSLLIKKQILEFLEGLKGKDYTIKELNRSMKKLFKWGKMVVPVCLSKLKESDEELAPIVCYALEYANDYSLINPLMDILIMPNVSDRVKTRILSVLAHYGVDASELPLEYILRDYNRITKISMMEMIEDINKDYFLLPYVLEDLQDFPLEARLSYIYDIGSYRMEKAIPILEVLAKVDETLVAEEAVKAISKIKSGKALFVLNRLLKKVKDEKVKKIIEREILRLKFSGISEIPYERPFKIKEPFKILLTSIDGLGSRALWIVWKHPLMKRKYCSASFLLNSGLGIKDCWSVSRLSLKEFKDSVKDLAKTTVIVETSGEYALKLLQDALHNNYKSDNPLPYQFYFWQGLIEESLSTEIVPTPYEPDFSDYDKNEIKFDHNYLIKTFDLLSYPIFEDWFFSEPQVYDYAEEYKSKKGFFIKKLTLDKTEKLFAKFTEEVVLPRINLLKRMLELSADFLKLLDEKELVKVVLSALYNLDMEPLYYHPFVQRIIIESLKVALTNMKNGFDMRSNPDVFD